MTGFLTAPSSGQVDKMEEAFTQVIELLCSEQSDFTTTPGDVSNDDHSNGDTDDDDTTASHTSSCNHKSVIDNEKRQQQLLSSLAGIVNVIEYPQLALRHQGHLKIDQSSRLEAEQEAVSLLARSVIIEVPAKDDSSTDTAAASENYQHNHNLLHNLYESFAILVDSRLRVYAKLFLQHLTGLVGDVHGDNKNSSNINNSTNKAFGILQMGQKLETLQDIGGQITATSMELRIELLQEEFSETTSQQQQQRAVHLENTMELLVPSPTGQCRHVSVRHETTGSLKGIVRGEDQKLHVTLELDTKALLKSMMDQASLMVAEIVETTNDAFCMPERKMERGESFFVMPPPMPRKRSAPSAGLDLLSDTAAVINKESSVLITPDLNSKTCNVDVVPTLNLEGEEHCGNYEDDTADVDKLSLDQCASIVDDVFGAMDDALLRGPCLKKARILSN